MYLSVLVFISARCAMAKGEGVLTVIPLWGFSVFSQNLVEMAGYWFCAGVATTLLTTARFRLTLRKPAPTPAFIPHPS
jgi:hypothetical protein